MYKIYEKAAKFVIGLAFEISIPKEMGRKKEAFSLAHPRYICWGLPNQSAWQMSNADNYSTD